MSRDAQNTLGVHVSCDSLTKRQAPKLPVLPPGPSLDIGVDWEMQDKDKHLRSEKSWGRQRKQVRI